MAELREVIADNLPSWADLYKGEPTCLPTKDELLAAADRIIAAAQRAGYQFYEYNPKPR